jgi:membrane-associated PAP2 superfamily phosphatase
MNERIKELAEQAGMVYDPDQGQFDNFDEQKFAELIVQECIKKCEFVATMAAVTNDGEMSRKCEATANSCSMMIKQHFGVK